MSEKSVKFAERMRNVNASITRETMKLASTPGMINFGGGMPFGDLFPIKEIQQAADKMLQEDGKDALQYSTTEGFLPLRQHIVEDMKELGIDCTTEDVLIISGSQQGLEFSAKIFVDPGDYVVCESPSYVAGLNAYRTYQPEFLEVDTDKHGMIIEDLVSNSNFAGR